jgi:ubiquinone/menaquinone biosynthesis C-methylase UbiE
MDQTGKTGFLDTVRDLVQVSVRTRYFPEIWYILENFFSLAKVKRVLEVGYGLGMVSEALAKSGWDVTCVDPSVTALSELKSRFDRAGLVANFEQAEPDTLPFPSNSFDFVVCVNTLELTRDPNAVVRELARVLRPGGKAVIATFNKLSPWGMPGIPQIMRPTQPDERVGTVRCLTRAEFSRLFVNNKLPVSDVKERARYLPVATRHSKLRLPLTGAFVALATKAAPAREPAAERRGK